MKKELTCIVCPNGCSLEAAYEQADGKVAVLSVCGNTCPRGEAYARSELTDPVRTLASSVLVEGGELPLVSVRTSRPIPKDRIMDVMRVIRELRVKAPVEAGYVLAGDVLGLGTDIVATKNVRACGN